MKIFQFQDARNYQILFLGTFFCYGLVFGLWPPHYLKYFTLLITALITQTFWLFVKGSNDYGSFRSAVITTLGMSLLLYTEVWWVPILAMVVAISSKFIFRVGNKHLFNPANIGVVTGLLTNQAWVSPGQWGSTSFWILLMGITGLVVVGRVGRLDLSLTFLVTYLGLLLLRDQTYLGWPFDLFTHKLTNGALLLFAFFMISDPRPAPNHKLARIAWAAGVAGLAWILGAFYYVNAPFIWALAVLSCFVPVLDYVLDGQNFSWYCPQKKR